MTTSTASNPPSPAANHSYGMLLGLIGVAMFSLTIPLTKIAVAELNPVFVMLARALGAAVLAGLWLRRLRAPLPPRGALAPLVLVAACCVVGFPLLAAMALRAVPAAHGAVVTGITPLASAAYATVRGHERPSGGFWLLAGVGSAIVVGFALSTGGGTFQPADWLLFGAVAATAVGYGEGGRLARSMGGPQVICWSLLLAAPVLAVLFPWLAGPVLPSFANVSLRCWLAFGYLTTCSMFLGFFFWYRGLALGGVARVGQVQLVQPFLSLVGATLFLGEPLTLVNCVFALAVVVVVFCGRRMQVR